MPLSFAQLTAPQSFTTLQQVLLNALQGLGVVVGSNGSSGVAVGTGTVALSGTPVSTVAGVANNPYQCIAKITTSGELGTAQCQVSIDNGVTYATAVTIPSNGQVAVTGSQGATGVTATFAGGPTGGGTSFISGDQYFFNLFIPSFPVNAWQSGSVPRVLVMTDAQALASWTQTIAAIAAGGLAQYATGPWADLLGQNVYNLTRTAAVSASVTCILTDGGQGPFTIAIGQLMASQNSNGQLYQNTTGGTLSKNGTLSLTFQALTPGAASSAADNTIQTLNTPLPAVTINNPGPGSMTISGADSETDSAYMQRCQNRWPTIGIGATAATYAYWATQGDPSIVKTLVQADGGVAGQVDIWYANATGPAAGSAVTAANAYINARLPLGIQLSGVAAISSGVTVSGVVNFYNSKTTSGACSAAVATALSTLFQNQAIGKDNTPTVLLYLNQIIGVIENVLGVRNVVLTGPTQDVGLTLGQVAVLTNSLTFTGV